MLLQMTLQLSTPLSCRNVHQESLRFSGGFCGSRRARGSSSRRRLTRCGRPSSIGPGHHRRIIATCVHGDQGPGATVVGRTGIGPLGFTDTTVITRWEPPRRCVLHHIGPLVHGDALFTVTPAGAGSQFSWTGQLQLPMAAAAHLAWPVIRPAAATRNAYVTAPLRAAVPSR
jgi:hypothetical protein